ncbi:MAG: hypothetical protein AAFV95_18875 [Bacteroidota bacterium]
MMRVLFFAFLMAASLSSHAQRLPETNLYLFDIEAVTDSIYRFSNPKFLSGFNLGGYNNQPSFVNDDELYITVQMPSDTTQSDIFALDLANEKLTRVTQTLESEFSPYFIPPTDAEIDAGNYSFSAVRIETDANRSQRLWRFPMDRSNKGSLVFRTIDNIGYYHWVGARRVALFLVGTPHRLVVADTRTETTVDIASDIGRCIQPLPNGNLAYVDKSSSGSWLLKRLDTRFYRSQLITATLPGSEDFAVLEDGTFLMGSGSKLYKLHPRKDNSWIEIADLSYYGILNISRLAVTDGKIALVGSGR